MYITIQLTSLGHLKILGHSPCPSPELYVSRLDHDLCERVNKPHLALKFKAVQAADQVAKYYGLGFRDYVLTFFDGLQDE